MRDQIPDYWTGEHAVTFVAFLDFVVDAVWARHGPAMADALRRQGQDATPLRIPDRLLDNDQDIDSLLPF